MVGNLGNHEARKEIFDLWQEYESGTTPEALIVKDLDKLEMLFQAFEYEKGMWDTSKAL